MARSTLRFETVPSQFSHNALTQLSPPPNGLLSHVAILVYQTATGCLLFSCPSLPVPFMKQAKFSPTRPDIDRAFAVVRPRPVLLSALGAPARIATRKVEARGPEFNEQFDDDTLAYDCFWMPDGRIALLGPSLFNLFAPVKAMTVVAQPSGALCRVEARELDRYARILIDAPPDTTHIALGLGTRSLAVPVSESGVDVFASRRVIFTLNKDNQLSWIRDWVRFAADHHGADAVLIYDNGSTSYSADELLEAAGSLNGIKAARVVEWPFKYGPQGIGRKYWDSNFCQHGAWEHARWRFLARARSAQNADIDELVVSKRGQSVFEAAEKDPFGIVSYAGRWVIGTSQTKIPLDNPDRTLSDYDTVLRPGRALKFGVFPYDPMRCPPKWTVVPGKCPPQAQWGVHAIFGWLPSRRVSRDLSFRHFREISNNWKYARLDRPDFDPQSHEHDPLLAAYFARS